MQVIVMMIVLGSKSNHHYDIACQIVGANTSSVLFSYKILELCFHTISVKQEKIRLCIMYQRSCE